jgi:hypothetical protein
MKVAAATDRGRNNHGTVPILSVELARRVGGEGYVARIKQHLFCNWLISEVGHLGFHVQVSTVSFPVVTDLCEYG